MMSETVILNFADIILQLSPFETVYCCAHDISGMQRICPSCKLVHPELIFGFAAMISEPVTLNSAPILSHVSPIKTTYSLVHEVSGIQRS